MKNNSITQSRNLEIVIPKDMVEVAKLFTESVIKKITIVHNERVFVIEGGLMIYVWPAYQGKMSIRMQWRFILTGVY